MDLNFADFYEHTLNLYATITRLFFYSNWCFILFTHYSYKMVAGKQN